MTTLEIVLMIFVGLLLIAVFLLFLSAVEWYSDFQIVKGCYINGLESCKF